MKQDYVCSGPLVSVIVPCYNVERLLDRCIHSLLAQSYRNLEIILVDDCSTDRTREICEAWQSRNPRIKTVLKGRNEGLGMARNSGLEVAEGEYVGFVDSDDFILPEFIATLIRTALDADSDIVICGYIRRKQNLKEVTEKWFDYKRVFSGDETGLLAASQFRRGILHHRMLVLPVCCSLYKREAIICKFESERRIGSEDMLFQLYCLYEAKKVAYVPDALYVYCSNPGSLTNTFDRFKFSRYKVFTAEVNTFFSGNRIPYRSDYYAFMIGYVLVRQICAADMSSSAKLRYIKELVENDFWREACLEECPLNFQEKIFLRSMRTGSPKFVHALSMVYSALFCRRV